MRIEKLTAHIGAELVGVDLTEAVSNDDLFGEIRRALLDHRWSVLQRRALLDHRGQMGRLNMRLALPDSTASRSSSLISSSLWRSLDSAR